jgi:hypothetical protein
LRYLERSELFYFIKKCVLDFRVSRRDIVYYKRTQYHKLFEKLKIKFPYLKDYEVDLLCKIIDDSKEKDGIYSSLGIEKPKKQKVRISKKKNEGSVSWKDFLKGNFSTMRV